MSQCARLAQGLTATLLAPESIRLVRVRLAAVHAGHKLCFLEHEAACLNGELQGMQQRQPPTA